MQNYRQTIKHINMKTKKLLISVFLILITCSVVAQNKTKHHLITIKMVEKTFNEKYNVLFDIEDSILIDGLNKKELEKKFDKTENISTVLNFTIDNGYRLLQTLALNGGSGFGNSNGTEGYLFILEKID
jgi:hypothetical protein